jgi:hypothetical protein
LDASKLEDGEEVDEVDEGEEWLGSQGDRSYAGIGATAIRLRKVNVRRIYIGRYMSCHSRMWFL